MSRAWSDLRLALRLLRRDRAAGELRLLAVSLVIAVASLTAVGFLADRIHRALAEQAQQLLGGDLVLKSDHPWSAATRAAVSRSGLAMAEALTFPSMALAPAGGHLAEVKAVSADYPLRGTLRTAPALGAADGPQRGVPARGEAWVDERLATRPGFAPGQRVQLGQITLTVTRLITQEPDRGINFFALAPRLMINADDVAATGLIQPGSRVRYRLLLAGERPDIAAFAPQAAALLERGQALEDLESARPEIRGALNRAERFLGLAASLAVVLAAVAVGLAARRYVQRHLDPSALMRCLGLSQARLLRLVLTQIATVGLLAAGAGIGLGYAAHAALVGLLAGLIETTLPLPSAQPAGQGVLVAVLLLAGFALPPLLHLRRVPPLRVLRRELGAPGASTILAYTAGAVALAALIVWTARDLRLAGWMLGGLVAGSLGFVVLAGLAVRAVRQLPEGRRFGLLLGLRAAARRPQATVLQTVALAIGGMALLLLTLTRGELLDAWQRATPPDAPNRFLVGVQPDQRRVVADALAEIAPGTPLWPMVRARLQAINEAPVRLADYPDERSRQLVEREFNLSHAVAPPPGNTVVAGRWFSSEELAGTAPLAAASVEAGLAQRLGWHVGDRLRFTVAGQPLDVRIANLRQLDWSSMRANFYVLLPPAALQAYPASDIASFYVPPAQVGPLDALVARLPNLTVIDVTILLRQMQQVLDQVSAAVQFLFVFTLAAGIAVLYGALLAAFDERRQELSVMRALGARQTQLRRALVGELATIGALAGLLAALAANGVGMLIGTRLFELDLAFNVWSLPAASLAGATFAAIAGWRAVQSLASAPALDVLRASD